MKQLVGQGKPFYSAMDMAAKALKRKVGTGSEFLKEMMALPGVKPTELKERGLEDLMNAPRMTHEEFLKHLNKKPAPAVREKVLENPKLSDIKERAHEIAYEEAFDQLRREGVSRHEAEDIAQEMAEDAVDSSHNHDLMRAAEEQMEMEGPAHGDWTLPGGENYREMLIKAPQGGDKFKGVVGHFNGEPDILASMRLKDRMTPEGKKLLHLEELQSDWHQQGREKGYNNIKDMPLMSADELRAKHESELSLPQREYLQKFQNDWDKAQDAGNEKAIEHLTNEYQNWVKTQQMNGVPNAPFKKNWEEMALKRLIHHAAEKGYHGIVVTPGQEQADRYSLSKHIDSLSYEKKGDKYHLRYVPKGGGTFETLHHGVAPEDLASHVGKEMAEKITNKEGNRAGSTGVYTFPNVDLQVGGEGMKAFYDKKVPNILNAIGKKHGVKTELHGHHIETHPERVEEQIAAPGIGHFPEPIVHPAKTVAVHHFPITEPMRQDILKNGLPLYKSGGMIHKAMGGTVQPSVNQMRTALMQNKLAIPSSELQSVGADEAPNLDTKAYINEGGQDGMGGVDMNTMQPGMQLMQAQPNLDPTKNQQGQPQGQPQGGMPPSAGASSPAQQPPSNILQMTRQGQALNAMRPPQPQGLKVGGQPSVEDMRREMSAKYKPEAKKASEVLGKHEGKHLKVTQSDRTKVGEGFLGGPGFSSLQHVDPNYKGVAWGVNSPMAASKMVNATRAHPEGNVLWSTLLGAPEQHTSNQMVFDLLLKQFKAAIKAGKMTPELRDAINAKLASLANNMGERYFEGNDNIANKNFFKNLNTFDQRREMANLMGGLGVGGKKGQIINYDKTVKETTEPELLGAPTHAIGPRLFQLSGVRSYQPELHPAFPHVLHGEDLGEMFHPVPKELMLPEFHEHIKKTKGRKLGFMDLTRNTPSQHLNEKFLTRLQKEGYKKGGKVTDNLDTMRLALTRNSKKKAK